MTDRTDGLSADGAARPEDDDTDAARMRDVSHTPPNGDGTNEVWARGEGDAVRPRDDDE